MTYNFVHLFQPVIVCTNKIQIKYDGILILGFFCDKTVANYTGIFYLNQEYLAGKAVKVLNVLLSNCKKPPIKT